MWKCKKCGTEIIEDWRTATDEWGNFIGEMHVGYVCPHCLNFGSDKEDIADLEEDNERDKI